MSSTVMDYLSRLSADERQTVARYVAEATGVKPGLIAKQLKKQFSIELSAIAIGRFRKALENGDIDVGDIDDGKEVTTREVPTIQSTPVALTIENAVSRFASMEVAELRMEAALLVSDLEHTKRDGERLVLEYTDEFRRLQNEVKLWRLRFNELAKTV